MKELANIIKVEEPEQLVRQLQDAGYAFASWRMPNTDTSNFIISLSEVERVDKPELNHLPTGFLLNEYAASHPVQPYHISADIIITNNDLNINPKVDDAKIDQFIAKLQSPPVGAEKRKNQPTSTGSSFENQVAKAVDEIAAGTFEKVVLSRYSDHPEPENFSPWDFYTTIRNQYKNAFCSLSFIPNKGVWIGATPELLISNDAKQFRTVALAGTKRLQENQALNEIAWTQKEIEEQAFVSRYIINCLKKIRLREFHEHGPKTIKAGNLVHLKTEFLINYSEVPSEGIADQMLSLLHPTSAVCGMPIDKTKPWIADVEKYDREFYSGFLGPVNFENSTDLFVNLRCMKVQDGTLRFFAGAGITEDSNPSKELEETEMKMNVLRDLINR